MNCRVLAPLVFLVLTTLSQNAAPTELPLICPEKYRALVSKKVERGAKSVDSPLVFGDPVVASGKKYTVASRLGEGAEAAVYLVNPESGDKVVAKVFTSLTTLKRNVAALQRMKELGVSVVSVIEVDESTLTLILPYQRGLTVQDISKPKVRKELFPDPADWLRFEDAYKAFIKKTQEQLVSEPGLQLHADFPANILYDVKEKKFIFIDPT